MLFRRIVSAGIAHHSYLVAEGGEAVVIDPRRDIDVYLELARARGLRIRHILETHRNEDYAIGSTALAAATGAEIAHGAALPFEYGESVGDGDVLEAGALRIRVLETPGHSPESLTFALADRRSGDDPVIAFTGDALFIGDTGRVDLAGPEKTRSMAGELHQSLFETILPLGDHVIVCPAHGGGSVCGGDISERSQSTLGYERRNNPDLQRADRGAFIEGKLAESHARPLYFARMEQWNLRGDAPILMRLPVPAPLSSGELAERIADGALIVDTRMPQAFAGGHIPGALNIWHGGLAQYLGRVVPLDTPIALVLDEHASVESAVRTLVRVGYDGNLVGVLRGGFESWQNEGREIARLGTIDTPTLRQRLSADDSTEVIDVRLPREIAGGTIRGARRIPLSELSIADFGVPRDRPVVTMCSVGHRAGIAASILARRGFNEIYNYLGGYTAWSRSHPQ